MPLAIEAMTLPEKLDALEQIWASLSKEPENVPMHDWQKVLLDDRERRLAAGDADLLDWDDVRRELGDLGR